MKHLFVFIGPPAGGKTTLAYALAKKLEDAVVIEVDKIKMQISGSVFGRDDAERSLWFEAICRAIHDAFKQYKHVIVDEGFFSKEYFDEILLGIEDVPRTVVKVMFDLGEHVRRDSLRLGGGDVDAVARNYNLFIKTPSESQIVSDIDILDPSINQDDVINMIVNHLESK